MTARADVPVGWPEGRPRILLTDAWLANAGDAAIAWALDGLVRSIVPDAAILHAAYQHAEVGPALPGLTFVPPLEDLLGTPWAPPAPGWEEAGAALVAGADVVVCQGGGFLVEAYDPIARLAALAEVVRRGRPLALVGLTVSPFRRAPARRYLREILGSARLVVARDPTSVLHLRELGALDAWLGTDLALALFADPPTDRTAGARADEIGVVLTDHHPDGDRREALAVVADRVLRAVLDAAPEASIRAWSTVQGLPEVAREDDAALIDRVVASLGAADRARVRREAGFVPPARAVELARCRALITMRMHPALFAAAQDTSTGLILGGQRVGVLAGTGLADRVASPDDPLAVRRVITAALTEDPPRAPLSPLRPRLEAMCTGLADLLAGVAERDSRSGGDGASPHHR